MAEMRHSQRQPIVVPRDCSMGIIAFKNFEWTDRVVRLADLGRSGVGIESGQMIEPGFVWFKDRVAGHKGGVVVWSRQNGEKFRAGIRLLPLSPDTEKYIQKECGEPQSHQSLREPEAVIATLMQSLETTEKWEEIGHFDLDDDTEH